MPAAHPRDDAKAARVVAAFGDFHVGEVPRSEAKARCGKVRDVTRTRVDFDQWTRGKGRRAEIGKCGGSSDLFCAAATTGRPKRFCFRVGCAPAPLPERGDTG